jgi:capsular polysaccharide biosynthesis protein
MRACLRAGPRLCSAPEEVQAPVASCVCEGLASVCDGGFLNARDVVVKACLQQVPHNRPTCRGAVRHGAG